MKQGELFKEIASRPSEDEKDKQALPPEERLAVRLTLDKIIFIALAALIFVVLVFMFGVEQGRKLQKEELRSQRAVESITNLARVSAIQKSYTPVPEEDVGRSLNGELAAIERKPAAKATPIEKSKSIMILFGQNTNAPESGTQAVTEKPKEEKKAKSKVPFSGLFSKLFGRSQETKTETVTPASPEPKSLETIHDELAMEPPAPLKPPVEETLPEPAPKKGYEARLMSVANETFGKKEVERLTKQGFTAICRKSGSYFLVTLGTFEKREEAEKIIKKAQAKGGYKDAYIRKIT